ncbi:hypothetical protein O181_133258 [Austropuccinia psidii MF-1]|uniref:Uncharacterized protein n=1 Tax=Austropuccinia psidii MF-1 TaxID=1389203 RepID=A0A9Q3L5D8_9BASI|nr:hypothetical protein [Austropuccinia psidii MF-1]
MKSTIIQTSNQKDKVLAQQKAGGKQERSPRSFYQKATSQPASPRREEEKEEKLEETISPSYRIPRIQKGAMKNVINMARKLMEFNNKEEKIMRQPHFTRK